MWRLAADGLLHTAGPHMSPSWTRSRELAIPISVPWFRSRRFLLRVIFRFRYACCIQYTVFWHRYKVNTISEYELFLLKNKNLFAFSWVKMTWTPITSALNYLDTFQGIRDFSNWLKLQFNHMPLIHKTIGQNCNIEIVYISNAIIVRIQIQTCRDRPCMNQNKKVI